MCVDVVIASEAKQIHLAASGSMDCFVAVAPRNDDREAAASLKAESCRPCPVSRETDS